MDFAESDLLQFFYRYQRLVHTGSSLGGLQLGLLGRKLRQIARMSRRAEPVGLPGRAFFRMTHEAPHGGAGTRDPLSCLGTGSPGGMPVGATVRLCWPGVEKNITIYKG
jgi:hypothetical protein